MRQCAGGDETRCAHLRLQGWPRWAPGLRAVLGLRVPHLGTWLYEVWAVAAPRTSDYGFWDSLEGYRNLGGDCCKSLDLKIGNILEDGLST